VDTYLQPSHRGRKDNGQDHTLTAQQSAASQQPSGASVLAQPTPRDHPSHHRLRRTSLKPDGKTTRLRYTGANAAEAAQQHGLRLEVVKHPMAKRGFVLLPRRWVVERSFAWAARFRRLARDYERLDTTLKGLHLLAFATLMLRNLAQTLSPSS